MLAMSRTKASYVPRWTISEDRSIAISWKNECCGPSLIIDSFPNTLFDDQSYSPLLCKLARRGGEGLGEVEFPHQFPKKRLSDPLIYSKYIYLGAFLVDSSMNTQHFPEIADKVMNDS